MAKGMQQKKATKKKPAKTMMEKRAEKSAKQVRWFNFVRASPPPDDGDARLCDRKGMVYGALPVRQSG